MIFIGDVCTNEYSFSDLEVFRGTTLYKYLNEYESYVIGNMEAPFLDEIMYTNENKASFINKCEFNEYLNFIDIYNLSNNHIMDQGHQGLSDTIDNLKKIQKGFFGAGDNIEEARLPFILNFKGKKICLLSYCCYSANSESYAKKSTPGPMPLVFEYIKEDIEKYKSQVDFIIVLPHWGIENGHYPTYDQVIFARNLIDIGVDAIIGTHTHTIQSFECYKGKAIYYSLGNFLMNDFFITQNDKYYWSEINKEAMLLEMDICEDVLTFKERFIKFNKHMIPDFVPSSSDLKTNIEEINSTLSKKTLELEHANYDCNLNLSLKYNGKSMQIVNVSNPVSLVFNSQVLSLKVKIKRIFMNKVRKLI